MWMPVWQQLKSIVGNFSRGESFTNGAWNDEEPSTRGNSGGNSRGDTGGRNVDLNAAPAGGITLPLTDIRQLPHALLYAYP